MNITQAIRQFIHSRLEKAVLAILRFSHLSNVETRATVYSQEVEGRFLALEQAFKQDISALRKEIAAKEMAHKQQLAANDKELRQEMDEHSYALALIDVLKPGVRAGAATHALASERVKEILNTKGRR